MRLMFCVILGDLVASQIKIQRSALTPPAHSHAPATDAARPSRPRRRHAVVRGPRRQRVVVHAHASKCSSARLAHAPTMLPALAAPFLARSGCADASHLLGWPCEAPSAMQSG